MTRKSKKEIRKILNIKAGGRLQINHHGAGDSSVLRIANNKKREYNCKTDDLYK
jgi:hypothetical protein